VLQQRSLAKITFPGIWANTCCSHPLSVPSELVEDEALGVRTAARRKLEQELGIDPRDVPLDSFTWVTRVHYVGASEEKAGGEPVWGEHEIDWILMCAPPHEVRVSPNPNEVAATRAFTQAGLREWMATRAAHGGQVSPWFGVMEESGLLYKWWDAVLEKRLDTVLERGVIHRQHDLQALAGRGARGKRGAAAAVPMPTAFANCLAATTARGTLGPLKAIACGPVAPRLSSASSPAAPRAFSGAPAQSSASPASPASAASSSASGPSAVRAAYVPGASAAVPKQGAYGKVRIHKDSLFSQLVHLDEVFVAVGFKLGLVRPVKVAGLSPTASPSLVFCEDMLCKVSRSFAMVIQQLPEHLRTSVCVFYLVLRGLDTIEDDMEAFKDNNAEKLRLLHAVHSFLDIPGWKMGGVGEGDEKFLLENFFHVNDVFQSLHPTDRAVIADICRQMGDGMAEFSGRDLREGTKTLADYDLYCHYVAGLVGEGLSKLFVAHGDEDRAVASNLKLADDMGRFLQKTNIIRDYLEDLVDGRAFWPRAIWSLYSERLCDLRDLISSPAPGEEGRRGREAALECLNHHVADALSLAPSCLRYMQRLRHADVFKFCAIPQVMAIATLDRLVNNADVFTGVLKIRKGQALLLMSQANSMEAVCTIFLRYTRQIAAAIPKRHKAAYALATRSAAEVEELCLASMPPGAGASLASRVLQSNLVIAGVMAGLLALLNYLYKQGRVHAWGEGGADGSYMPRITDSWDVAACSGVVVCVMYLLACGGMSMVSGKGSKDKSV